MLSGGLVWNWVHTGDRKSFDPKLSSPVISEMDTTIVIANIFRSNEDGNGAQHWDGSRFTLTTINTTKLGMIRITIYVRKKKFLVKWNCGCNGRFLKESYKTTKWSLTKKRVPKRTFLHKKREINFKGWICIDKWER